MKFHLKMTFYMLALLSLFFGIGGSMLISASFRSAMKREKISALDSYRMAWGTLQIVNSLDLYLDHEVISHTMEQLQRQNSVSWTALRLSTDQETLYETGTDRFTFPTDILSDNAPEPGVCLARIWQTGEDQYYLVFSGAVETNGDVLYLTASHDITTLYLDRKEQKRAYLQIFFVMCLLCGGLSYTVSKMLTAPLSVLSRASRAIASGNYSRRIRVRSGDEIGTLTEDFNAMAEQLEANEVQTEAYIMELRESVERQERFVGSFAHEMKTPMTSLIGYAELIRSGMLTPEEQTEAAGYLYSEGRRLESLSRKLLDLLVIQKHDMPLTEIDPAELIFELIQRLEPFYKKQGIAIACECESGACLLEPDLVWSLLLNLADNAQKSMEDGGELLFRLHLLEDGCRIQVLDTGRGIPPQALAYLTEAFYRVDKSRSRKQGGFGLGLALCQEIAALHHGSIRFENRMGGGVCVTTELRGGRP